LRNGGKTKVTLHDFHDFSDWNSTKSQKKGFLKISTQEMEGEFLREISHFYGSKPSILPPNEATRKTWNNPNTKAAIAIRELVLLCPRILSSTLKKISNQEI